MRLYGCTFEIQPFTLLSAPSFFPLFFNIKFRRGSYKEEILLRYELLRYLISSSWTKSPDYAGSGPSALLSTRLPLSLAVVRSLFHFYHTAFLTRHLFRELRYTFYLCSIRLIFYLVGHAHRRMARSSSVFLDRFLARPISNPNYPYLVNSCHFILTNAVRKTIRVFRIRNI